MCHLPEKKPPFWTNFGIWRLLYPAPFTDKCQNLVYQSRPMVYAYIPTFVSINLFCRLLAATTPKFCTFCGVAGNLRKLYTGAQLQTFPYPTVSKSFLYSNVYIAKSGIQTLTFKSVTANIQADKKTQRFWPTGRRVNPEPYQTWHGDRGHQACSCTYEAFGGPTHSFADMGR